jgi:hypothetical protein
VSEHKRRQSPVVAGGHSFREDGLDHEHVHEDEACLKEMQAERSELLVFGAVGRDLAALAVVDDLGCAYLGSA